MAPDDDDEATADPDPAWQKPGDAIFGRKLKDAAGSKQESLLQYHRPMLEDGEVSYEFFHDPGKAAVHPALDRLAFLIEPGGVKLHRLTDGPADRTGLAPDNLADEPRNRRGPADLPIKPGAWNRMALAVLGDKVTLRLNDVLIDERPIEPTNQRTFGLFHYADEAEARVRNVTYRGSWSKQTGRIDSRAMTCRTSRPSAGKMKAKGVGFLGFQERSTRFGRRPGLPANLAERVDHLPHRAPRRRLPGARPAPSGGLGPSRDPSPGLRPGPQRNIFDSRSPRERR